MNKIAAAKQFVLKHKAVIATTIAVTTVVGLVVADLVMEDDREPIDVLIITPEA